MKNTSLLLLFGLFILSCSGPESKEKEIRTEKELLDLLHAWSNSDSLNKPEIEANYTQALDEFIEHYPSSKEHETFLFLAASHANKKHENQKAASYFSRFAELYPNSRSHADALFGAAFLYNNEIHNYDSARKYYETFILLYPEHLLKPAAEDELQHLGETPEQMIESFKQRQKDSTKEQN